VPAFGLAWLAGWMTGRQLILVAVGVMNIAAMIGLTAVVLIEKTWRWVRRRGGQPASPRWPWQWR
jgi:predicted metal-binding membrane protein